LGRGISSAAWCAKKSAENYVQRLIDPDCTDNRLSAPAGMSDHIIIPSNILST
jgi:hypothetical protein